MKKYPNAIVITGTIGCGKSTVSNMLKMYGFKIIDADKINHQILDEISDKISLKFGKEYVQNGKVIRKKLGDLVFNDKIKLEQLENLLHKKIKKKIFEIADKYEQYDLPYFIDLPLFFEKQNYKELTKVLVVYAPKNLLIQRVMARNSLTRSEALARISLQKDIEEKKKFADYIIDNSKDIKSLEDEIIKFIKILKNKYPNLKV